MKLLIPVLLSVTVVNGARILGVFPYPSHSHQVVFKALAKELAKRGHEIIIFTTHPDNIRLDNYTEVSLESTNKYQQAMNFFDEATGGMWRFFRAVQKFSAQVTDEALSNPVMQEYLSPNSKQKFDLVLVQAMFYDGIYTLSYHFDAPMIGVSSLPTMAVNHYILGNPLGIAYTPDIFVGYTSEMTLWQRIVNLYYIGRQILDYETIFLPLQEQVVRKHFGDKMPPVRELSKRMSLILTSSQEFFSYPHPNVPSLIYMGGARRQESNTTLPKNIEEIFDKSKHGVIYFSLGSNLKSSHLPAKVRNALIEAFAELPYTVLWKFETEEMKDIPKNIITRKWLPQREILAHPKTVLFMYQGGLQSTEEATNYGLPLIGFPLFSDQVSNVMRLQHLGVCKRMDLTNLDKDELKNTIHEMITNPRYKENALKLRNLFQDMPYHPMDNALWWIEHTIRHKGADHLRNRARDIPLYQTLLLDIIGIALLILAVILYCSILLIRFLLRIWKHSNIRDTSVSKMPKKKEQ